MSGLKKKVTVECHHHANDPNCSCGTQVKAPILTPHVSHKTEIDLFEGIGCGCGCDEEGNQTHKDDDDEESEDSESSHGKLVDLSSCGCDDTSCQTDDSHESFNVLDEIGCGCGCEDDHEPTQVEEVNLTGLDDISCGCGDCESEPTGKEVLHLEEPKSFSKKVLIR
jgi:hypothetical protein